VTFRLRLRVARLLGHNGRTPQLVNSADRGEVSASSLDGSCTAPYATKLKPIRIDKGTPGQSRGRKATGPRILRDA